MALPVARTALDGIVRALVEHDGAPPESARVAVAEAVAEFGAVDTEKLYLAARNRLHLDFEVVPQSRPAPRGGTRKDTPAAKRIRR